MKKPTLSEDERRWRAESDARTLGEYQEIISDKARLKAATEEAKKMAKDLQDRSAFLTKSVTGIKSNKNGRK